MLGKFEQDVLRSENGDAIVVSDATVEVRAESDGHLLTSSELFSDQAGTTPLGNPFTVSGSTILLYAPVSDRYRLAITQGSFSRTLRYVTVNPPPISDFIADDLLPAEDAASAQAVLDAVGATTLASSAGAGLVGYINAGTGAVARSVQAALRDYKSVKDFGAVGDGTADDTAAIQAAIDSLTTGGGLFFPCGRYKISAKLTLGNGSGSGRSTVGSIALFGEGVGGAASEAYSEGATVLQWYGAPGGTMMGVNGPIAGVQIEGLEFDCRSLANTALDVMHAFNSRFVNVKAKTYTGIAIKHSAYDTVPDVVIGANNNIWDTVVCADPASGGCGMQIGASSYGSSPHLDVAKNSFINCELVHDSSSAANFSLELCFADNLTFIGCQLMKQGGTAGFGLKVSPPSGGTAFPGNVQFIQCYVAGVTDSGTAWTGTNPILFFPYMTGEGDPVPTGNYAWGLDDQGNWFGTLAPSVFRNGYVANRYYGSPMYNPQTATTFTVTKDRLYSCLHQVTKRTTFTRIGISVTSGGTGSVRLGIYRFVDGVPTELVLDCGSVSISAASGIFEATINKQLEPGLYALAADFSADGVVVRAATVGAVPNMLLGVQTPGTVDGAENYMAHTFGALPATWGTNVPGSSVGVGIHLRVA